MYLFSRRLALLLSLFLFLKLLHVSPYARGSSLFCTELLNVELMESCCGKGVPSRLILTSSNCEQHESEVCQYECAFKHYHLMNSDQILLMANVSSMVRQLYKRENGHRNYGELLLTSYHRCHHLAKSYTGLIRMYTTLSDLDQNVGKFPMPKCNNKGLVYARCAIANVFLSCPHAFWQNTVEDCPASRRLMGHCVNFLTEMDNEKNAQRQSGSRSYHFWTKKHQTTAHWYMAFINWLVF